MLDFAEDSVNNTFGGSDGMRDNTTIISGSVRHRFLLLVSRVGSVGDFGVGRGSGGGGNKIGI